MWSVVCVYIVCVVRSGCGWLSSRLPPLELIGGEGGDSSTRTISSPGWLAERRSMKPSFAYFLLQLVGSGWFLLAVRLLLLPL